MTPQEYLAKYPLGAPVAEARECVISRKNWPAFVCWAFKQNIRWMSGEPLTEDDMFDDDGTVLRASNLGRGNYTYLTLERHEAGPRLAGTGMRFRSPQAAEKWFLAVSKDRVQNRRYARIFLPKGIKEVPMPANFVKMGVINQPQTMEF